MKEKELLDDNVKSLIEERGAKRFEQCFKLCGTIFIIFEAAMILYQLIFERDSVYTLPYIFCYSILLVTCICVFIEFHYAKKLQAPKKAQCIKRAEIFFMIVIEIWALAITFIDAFAFGFVDILVYVSILALLPSIFYLHPAIVITSQIIIDIGIYFLVYYLNPQRLSYYFLNFTTYITISCLIYFLSYKIQKELYTREALLLKTAEKDALTGLQNRFSYSNYLEMLKSHPENRNFAIILFDVNGLKTTNDTLGHAYGDDLIKGASYCIYKAFHKNGVCFRTGGDEFVVILNKRLSEIAPMMRIFETLCQNWKGELVTSISVSYGFSEALVDTTLSVDQLVELADKRMYEMKQIYHSQEHKAQEKPQDNQSGAQNNQTN